jgi:hypothetical protein
MVRASSESCRVWPLTSSVTGMAPPAPRAGGRLISWLTAAAMAGATPAAPALSRKLRRLTGLAPDLVSFGCTGYPV